MPNPLEGYLERYFVLDPSDTSTWTSTSDIVDRLFLMGYKAPSARVLAMEVATTLQERGHKKCKRSTGSGRVWGYLGITPSGQFVP